MRNATSRIKEATSALQSELLQQLEALDNDRDTIRTRLTAENDTQAAEIKTQAAKIKSLAANKETLEADLYDEKMRNKKVEEALTAEVKTLAAKLKTAAADKKTLEVDLYNQKTRNKNLEQNLQEERIQSCANRDAIKELREIKQKCREMGR